MINKCRVSHVVALCLFLSIRTASVSAQVPPFSGTGFLSTEIITDSDPSSFASVNYVGQENRLVFDRRVNAWTNIEMQLFNADFVDGLTAEIRVNPEFGSVALSEIEATKYGESIGRLPKFLRKDMESVTIHKGIEPFGGGNNNILIHTGQADEYGGFLEEILMHEASHTSMDADHAQTADWLAAQQSDANFVSTYARDFPNREDVAESVLPWFAVRHRRSRIDESVIDLIEQTIPGRLSYFDNRSLEIEPEVAHGDFDGNGVLDVNDITSLITGVAAVTNDRRLDLDGDGSVDTKDVDVWIHALKGTWYGDVNLDGEFNSSDLITVFQGSRFETDEDATWTAGDWNGDLRFDSADLIVAFQDGGYEKGPFEAIHNVPESSSFLCLAMATLIIARQRRRCGARAFASLVKRCQLLTKSIAA